MQNQQAKNSNKNANQNANVAVPVSAPVSAPVAPVAPMVATVSAPVVSAPAYMHTVPQHTALRAARLQAVYKAYRARAQAARMQAHVGATQAHIQANLLAQVQALYQAAGLPAPTAAVRNVPVTQKHAPSAKPGACARVRAWVHANPHATCAQAKAHFGALKGEDYVNPATVQTQYGLAKKGKA